MIEHNYLVNRNAQSSGVHKVHKEECDWLPDSEHRLPIGTFGSINEAVKEARRYYRQSEGCGYCC